MTIQKLNGFDGKTLITDVNNFINYVTCLSHGKDNGMEEPGQRQSGGSSCGYMVMEQDCEASFHSSVALDLKR